MSSRREDGIFVFGGLEGVCRLFIFVFFVGVRLGFGCYVLS